MRVGYARVSSRDQDLTVQLDKLRHCEKVYQEKYTGTTDKRPQLQACLDFVREGDVLVITRLDRLARSLLHLYEIDRLLKQKHVKLQVIEQQIDTTTPHGQALFGMLGVFAQFENDLRAERQREGIAKAQSNGVKFGRKAGLTSEQVRALALKRQAGAKIVDLMYEYRLSKAVIYRYLSQAKDEARTEAFG